MTFQEELDAAVKKAQQAVLRDFAAMRLQEAIEELDAWEVILKAERDGAPLSVVLGPIYGLTP